MSNLITFPEQGSYEWLLERAGKLTGSTFVDLIAKRKDGKGYLKAHDDLIWQLATERITGVPVELPNAFAMRHGKEMEPIARRAYELEYGVDVIQVGFIKHPDFEHVGASPDGLIEDDGGFEVKCPVNPTIHLERIVNGMPEEMIPQVQACMWVTGRKWWDWCSYDSRFPEPMRLVRCRLQRDDVFIKMLEKEVVAAEVEIQKILEVTHLKLKQAA